MNIKMYSKATSLIGQEADSADGHKMMSRPFIKELAVAIALLNGVLFSSELLAVDVPVTSSVIGEIEQIHVDSPNDHWSSGSIVVGGQAITIPRNLLIDLPANRMTLQQLYKDAPAACITALETGLAKADSCNASVSGGIATIAANRLSTGQVIAGDVLIEKGAESVTGQITFIDANDGYFRINGVVGSNSAGVMVRLNDPTSRHTVQSGQGCLSGANNCSADPRFALDADNYTNTFVGGFPLCIPSTVARDVPSSLTAILTLVKATALGLVKGANPLQKAWSGSDDALCPLINRPGFGLVSGDSRRFAPIKVGDSMTVEGNYEEIGGVRFLSAHTSQVGTMLTTNSVDASMPDYMEFEEAFIDAPGFQNQRARSLFIGFVTRAPADIMIWSIHYDPTTNSPHEFPLATTLGCDAASGANQCTAQGIAGLAGAGNIFRIKHDVDFVLAATNPTKVKPALNPCAHLNADSRFNSAAGQTVCSPGAGMAGTFAEQFAIFAPMPHEIQARTGRKFADIKAGNKIIAVDVNGQSATWGQYLMPFGIGLGGIDMPNFLEIDPTKLSTPYTFTGLPWNLDRRLSPGGCWTADPKVKDCSLPLGEVAAPLIPFPFEETDPRLLEPTLTHGALPVGAFTSVALTDASDRILSFVAASALRPLGNGAGENATGHFTNTLLNWDQANAALPGVNDTPATTILACAVSSSGSAPSNSAPIAGAGSVSTNEDTVATILLTSFATDADNGPSPLSVVSVAQPANGVVVKSGNSVTYTPKLNYNNTLATVDSFSYVITDGKATVTGKVDVLVNPVNDLPIAVNDAPASNVNAGATLSIDALLNDTDIDGDVLTISSVGTASLGGSVTLVKGAPGLKDTISYVAPASTLGGNDVFSYTISDGFLTASATVTVKVVGNLLDTLTFNSPKLNNVNLFTRTVSLNGTGSVAGKVISVYTGSVCPVVGTPGWIGRATVGVLTNNGKGNWSTTTSNIIVNANANVKGKTLVACSSGLGRATGVIN